MKESQSLALRAVRRLLATGNTLATAESCTGGLIAKLITDIPGSSEAFSGGLVTYTNHLKCKLLGVRPETIERYTEVSLACAAEMAEGARRATDCTVGVSTTGFAGPGGGTPEDPVGTVYIAVSTSTGTVSERFSAPPDADRQQVRSAAAHRALELVLKQLEN